ncbi:MAG TPA: gamma-glutamyl-gamma-aminobutyrate hydrolase family protein [Acidimicrobiia bacterium]|nr:gamma-glutamyl-gamma-aminobutyrate hydrolase family protein [Acidimicrobiia bacterium]
MPVIGLSCWERPLDTTIASGERHHMLSSTYTAAITAAGGTPLLLPSVDPTHARAAVERLDGLVITGGGDIDPARYGAENTASIDIDHARDAWELALLEAARDLSVPMLGVCRGVQILNVGLGGSLLQHVWDSDAHVHLWNPGRTHLATGHHDVRLAGVLADIYGSETHHVNSLHHQSLDRLGLGLAVVATAPDGRIEAVTSTGPWKALGVQWHPERLDGDDPLFRWVVAGAAERQAARVENTREPSDSDTVIVSPSE